MAIQDIVCSLFKLGASCSGMPLDTLLVEFLLIPSVVMIIFLYVSVNMFLRGEHPKIKPLLAITFYITIIYSGFYGTFAMFISSFLPLFIAGTFILFVATRFISPSQMKNLGGVASKAGEFIYDRSTIKDRIMSKYSELVDLDKKMTKLFDFKTEDADDFSKEGKVILMLRHEVRMELENLIHSYFRAFGNKKDTDIMRVKDYLHQTDTLNNIDNKINKKK
ncbi:MAG: hypothetical protein DRP06_02030 [Candidatus Aenigmatarchaeota archaeon]|nr:MAG: hypothetical protein DRP06_02030 [Candidatus Aenigmarchaeota archaeon]